MEKIVAILVYEVHLLFSVIFYIYFLNIICRCFGMLLSPGRNVKNSDMHLLDMVIILSCS